MRLIPFIGQRVAMSRVEAIERYVLVRLRTEEIKRLAFLVENLHSGALVPPKASPFTCGDLKDTARTAFFGWFASLTDRNSKAVYAFDPLLALFPHHKPRIIVVQTECEACHAVLQRFRGNVAFHNRADVAAHIGARQALRAQDTLVDLEFARVNFLRLMADLVSEELDAIPELPEAPTAFQLTHHPAFANLASAGRSASPSGDAFYRCDVLE